MAGIFLPGCRHSFPLPCWWGKEDLVSSQHSLLSTTPSSMSLLISVSSLSSHLSLSSTSSSSLLHNLTSPKPPSRPKYWQFDMGFLKAFFKFLDAAIGPASMLLFPLYASLRAIETPSTVDDQQWLTYWILYSLITLLELSCWRILAWLPFWPYMKLLFCVWLVLPYYNGAAYIYTNYVRKYAKIGSSVSSSYPESQRKVLLMMSPDARRAVEGYISKYGPEAFERVVKAAEKEARKH